MNATELAEIVDQRLAIAEQLVALTSRQAVAIDKGHMSELMAVLSDKQAPIQSLAELSKRLGATINEDPDARQWPNAEARQRTRDRHNRCEELIAAMIEAEQQCEAKLSNQHSSLQAELDRAQGVGRAIQSYSSVSAGFQAGGHTTPHEGNGDRLDLSSQ